MKRLDMLFFTVPMFSDGTLPPGVLMDDNYHGKDIPRGSLSIASFLGMKGKQSRVIVLDAFFPKRMESFDALMKRTEELVEEKVEEYNPRFVGLDLMFGFREKMVVRTAQFIKERFPDIVILVGGNHATFTPERLLSRKRGSGIDIVVRGEGERTVEDLLSCKNLYDTAGVSFRDNGRVIHNPRREELPILDLPPNNYSLIDGGKGVNFARFNYMLQYLRGCNMHCSFCTNKTMWGERVRPHSIESFRTELLTVMEGQGESLGDSMVILHDDNLMAAEKYWRPLFLVLEEGKKLYPKARFVGQARVSNAKNDDKKTHEMLEWAGKIGLGVVFLGIETGSQPIFDAMGKNCRVEWVEPACRNLKKHGIAVGAFWMFGHPGATMEEEERSLAFLEHLLSEKLLDAVELHMTTPFPGTAIRSDPRVDVLVSEEEEPDKYCMANKFPIHRLVDPSTGNVVMSAEQIAEILGRAHEIQRQYLGDVAAAVPASSI